MPQGDPQQFGEIPPFPPAKGGNKQPTNPGTGDPFLAGLNFPGSSSDFVPGVAFPRRRRRRALTSFSPNNPRGAPQLSDEAAAGTLAGIPPGPGVVGGPPPEFATEPFGEFTTPGGSSNLAPGAGGIAALLSSLFGAGGGGQPGGFAAALGGGQAPGGFADQLQPGGGQPPTLASVLGGGAAPGGFGGPAPGGFSGAPGGFSTVPPGFGAPGGAPPGAVPGGAPPGFGFGAPGAVPSAPAASPIAPGAVPAAAGARGGGLGAERSPQDIIRDKLVPTPTPPAPAPTGGPATNPNPNAGEFNPATSGGPGTVGGFDILGPGGQISIPQILQQMLPFGLASGLFNPAGSPIQTDLIRNSIMESGRGEMRRAATAGQLFGDDPFLRRSATINAEQGIADRLANATAQGQLGASQDSMERLFQMIFGFAGPGGAVQRRDPRETGGARFGLRGPGGVGGDFEVSG